MFTDTTFFDVFQANLLKKDDILAITPGRFAEKSRYLIENATSDMILSALTSDRRPRTQIRPKPIAKKSKKAEKGACRRPTKTHVLTNIEIAVASQMHNYVQIWNTSTQTSEYMIFSAERIFRGFFNDPIFYLTEVF